ncbi:hypothetical protein [Empedobacter sp. R132-2]|uniref:hypothetical protein n=1 Tax=Empedobacter sp. R132-2 TaxID=2746740 RepID=UPI00257550F1|nr:hypothetical protein [Empedobacter sp. R132-2]MDM1139971.1 hypothetical protein [Empedobacter sp. R132-2]
MNDRTTRLQQKFWEIERNKKSEIFSKFLLEEIGKNYFEILAFDFSDNFIKNAEKYPQNKYERNLFQQIELNKEKEVVNYLNEFFEQIGNNFVFIFSYHYNFGLTKMQKIEVIENWQRLLEFDGDEIMIFNPENGKFISIELTEEFMINKEEKGRIKFYELTPSER